MNPVFLWTSRTIMWTLWRYLQWSCLCLQTSLINTNLNLLEGWYKIMIVSLQLPERMSHLILKALALRYMYNGAKIFKL